MLCFVIGDLGLLSDYASLHLSSCCGTITTMAPQILSDKVFNCEADIWSLGVVMYYIITGGKYPFKGFSKDERLENMRSFKLPQNTPCTQEMIVLLYFCLRYMTSIQMKKQNPMLSKVQQITLSNSESQSNFTFFKKGKLLEKFNTSDTAIMKEIEQEYQKARIGRPNYRWDVFKLLNHPFLRTQRTQKVYLLNAQIQFSTYSNQLKKIYDIFQGIDSISKTDEALNQI